MRQRLWMATILFLVVQYSLLSQSPTLSGRVIDAKTKEALPFAAISIENVGQGVVSDIEGYFSIKIPAQSNLKLKIQYVGYKTKSLEFNQIKGTFLVVALEEAPMLLGEVAVFPGVNPAHAIIQKVYESKNRNDPEQLPYFIYKSYTKFILDLEEIKTEKDSIPIAADTAKVMTRADSTNQEIKETMEKQYLFLSESVAERKYKKPGKINETVLASRTSGFDNPMFVVLGTQLQSFTFYKENIRILGETYESPINKNPFNNYYFIIEDTLYQHLGADSVVVISFKNKPNKQFKTMKGLLYISLSDYALTNVIAEPAANDPSVYVSIQQQYEKELGYWFPTQLNSDFVLKNVNIGAFAPLGKIRTYLTDITLDTVFKKKEFRGVNIKVLPEAGERDQLYWDQFRTHTLSEKEKTTYTVIDSIGKKNNFEGKLRLLQALGDGKYVYKYIEFPLDKLLAFNLYEGFRLGLAINTSDRFSEKLKTGGYFAYGFNDKTWKYGYHASLLLDDALQFRIGGSYRFDLVEAGMPEFHFEQNSVFNPSGIRKFYITGWDQSSMGEFFVEIHPSARWKNRIALQRDNRFFVGEYAFLDEENARIGKGFTFAQINYHTQYAPNDKYLQTYMGRRPISYTYPRYDLSLSYGFQGFMRGEYNYTRLDVKYSGRLGKGRLGYFYYQVQAGSVQGNVPISLLYVGQGNIYAGANDQYRTGLGLADRNAFETMGMNEFMLRNYAQVFLRYDFQNALFNRKPLWPHIELVSRALWGTHPDENLHQGVGVGNIEDGFYESGIEINKIPTGKIALFNSLGLGFYYRLGNLSENEFFAQRYRFKLTSKF